MSDGLEHQLAARSDGEPATRRDELDAAVVRSLARLTGGEVLAFADADEPPQDWLDRLAAAPPPLVNGLLIHVLRRWHEVRSSR